MVHTNVAGIAVMLVVVAAVRGAAADDDSLAAKLEEIRATRRVPALAAARLAEGSLAEVACVGVRRLGTTEAVTIDDRFHLGSCGKSMTATLLALLIADGKLRWDSTLGELFPERIEAIHVGFRSTTVRQLVDHRAGLPANTTARSAATSAVDPKQAPVEQRLAILDAALAEPPEPIPARGHVYSNTGFLLAGAIIERVTAQPFEEVARERLFAPLGMTSAGFGPPGRDGSASPWGHESLFDLVAPAPPRLPSAGHPPWYAPAGDLHANLADALKFLALHVEAPAGDDARPIALPATALAVMHAPTAGADVACGFALTTRAWTSGPVLAHGGTSAGWQACFELSTQERVAFVVACNQGGAAALDACRDALALLAARHLAARER